MVLTIINVTSTYLFQTLIADAGSPTARNQEHAYLKLFPVRVESTQNSPPGYAEVFQCYSTVYPDASAHLLRCSHPTQCKFMETWVDSDDVSHVTVIGSKQARDLKPKNKDSEKNTSSFVLFPFPDAIRLLLYYREGIMQYDAIFITVNVTDKNRVKQNIPN